MYTVHQVSEMAGVSIRTLQYYDTIGLLKPVSRTDAGYRLYDDTALETLQQILLFRELEFSLTDIKQILTRPDFDRMKALEQQIRLLSLKKERLENLIAFARKLKSTGGKQMDFSAFDTKKLDEYAKQAKETWGQTPAYQEFEEKSRSWTKEDRNGVIKGLMDLFVSFGALRKEDPAASPVQAQVKKLQDYITAHFYTCTPEILSGLGQMYACGGEMTDNIDQAGGPGTAAFTAEAIRIYCGGLK